MFKNLKEIDQRIGVFDDTEEMLKMLGDAADEQAAEGKYDYVLRETIVHVYGLWELITEMRKYIDSQENPGDRT